MTPKSFLTSKTLAGIAAMLSSSFAPAFLTPLVAALFTRLHLSATPDDIQWVVLHLLLWGGGALAAYGRLVARQPLALTAPPTTNAWLIALLLPVALCFAGCSTVQSFFASPAGQVVESAGKSAALAAAKLGLGALGAQFPVLLPITTAVSLSLPGSAAAAQTPEQTAAAIRAAVAAATPDPATQQQLLTAIAQAQTAPPSTAPGAAAGDETAAYRAAVARALLP